MRTKVSDNDESARRDKSYDTHTAMKNTITDSSFLIQGSPTYGKKDQLSSLRLSKIKDDNE